MHTHLDISMRLNKTVRFLIYSFLQLLSGMALILSIAIGGIAYHKGLENYSTYLPHLIIFLIAFFSASLYALHYFYGRGKKENYQKKNDMKYLKTGVQDRKVLRGKCFSIFHRILFFWIASIITVTLLGELFKIDVQQFGFLQPVLVIVPSIDNWALSSKHENTIRLLWTYMTITGPMILILMLRSIKTIHVEQLTKKEIYLFIGIFLISFFTSFIGWRIDGDALEHETRFSRLFYTSLFYAVVVSISSWMVLLFSSIVMIGLFKKKVIVNKQ